MFTFRLKLKKNDENKQLFNHEKLLLKSGNYATGSIYLGGYILEGYISRKGIYLGRVYILEDQTLSEVRRRKTIASDITSRQKEKRDTKEFNYDFKNPEGQRWIRKSGLTYTQKCISVIDNPQGLSPSPLFLPQKSISLPYPQKSVYLIGTPQGHDIQQRTYSTFCNNFYSRWIWKRIHMLYIHIITQSGSWILTTGTTLHTNYTLACQRHEIKEKKEKPCLVYFCQLFGSWLLSHC